MVKTAEGYRVFKVYSKEPAGQRELTDPRVQQNIRETLINRKDQLLRAAYYEVARDEAKVVNYLAMSISENKRQEVAGTWRLIAGALGFPVRFRSRGRFADSSK